MVLKKIKENWITHQWPPGGVTSTLFLVLLLILGTSLYWHGIFNADEWMPASGTGVLKHHQYWRLWSGLFAHGDLAHILGNLFLFIPFAYFLSHYFGLWLFPFFAFLIGGLINFLVIQTLPEQVTLIGVSGVVYWMGATWMTLDFFIDKRESFSQRLLKASGVSVILFFPTTFLPEVSYLSHFLGYVFGVLTGTIVYILFKKKFKALEIIEEINEEEEFFDWENFSEDKVFFSQLENKDLPQMRKWLDREHIKKNMRGPIHWDELVKKIGINNLDDFIFPYIVYVNHKPVGFIQFFDLLKLDHSWWRKDEEGAFGVNLFIGDKNLLNKGLGSTFIKNFIDLIRSKKDVTLLIAFLDPNNIGGIRAFKKAGFSRGGISKTPDGDCLLMKLN